MAGLRNYFDILEGTFLRVYADLERTDTKKDQTYLNITVRKHLIASAKHDEILKMSKILKEQESSFCFV